MYHQFPRFCDFSACTLFFFVFVVFLKLNCFFCILPAPQSPPFFFYCVVTVRPLKLHTPSSWDSFHSVFRTALDAFEWFPLMRKPLRDHNGLGVLYEANAPCYLSDIKKNKGVNHGAYFSFYLYFVYDWSPLVSLLFSINAEYYITRPTLLLFLPNVLSTRTFFFPTKTTTFWKKEKFEKRQIFLTRWH